MNIVVLNSNASFDQQFNMSDLPLSEEEFLAASKDSSHIPIHAFVDRNGALHNHSGADATLEDVEVIQHDVSFNGTHVIHSSAPVVIENGKHAGATQSKAVTKKTSKGPEQLVHSMTVDFVPGSVFSY